MSNKTISINPSLFSLGGSKTKKNREKKTKPTAVPIISPNVLKNKLLKRIKEHKQRETQDLDNNKRKLQPKIENATSTKNNFTDEFNDSINYLQTLSKQKRINDEKKNYEVQKQRQKEELERRTIRNYHSIGGENIQNQVINIDLPDELLQPTIQAPIISEPYRINTPYKGGDVPYGVLKGGSKPCYREWCKTQRNNIVTNPNLSLIIEGGNLSSEKTARENRLNLLKEKIRQKELSEKKDSLLSENLIKKPISSELLLPPVILPQPQIILSEPNIQQNQDIQSAGEQIIATKHITKKTIKRKYTLGKSDMKRKVAVLIKDRGTRKKILTAQKELKRKNINDVKEYLRDHNLIKAGSGAPNDVLRKLYESAMLSGEITNSNSDILLHNFTKEDKAL
jgi:hypothetical protein